ncbi:hypothetical protein [Calidifontibacter terrae]
MLKRTVLMVGVVSLSACGGATSPKPAKSTAIARSAATRPRVAALNASGVKAILADYDRRNNPAIARSATGDDSGWAAADSGGVLAADRYQTAAAAAMAQKVEGKPQTSVADAFREGADGQGRWLLTSHTRSSKDEKGKIVTVTDYHALVPGSGSAGWKVFLSSGAYGASRLPAGLPAGLSGAASGAESGAVDQPRKQAVANSIDNALYALGNGNTADFAFAGPLTEARSYGFNTAENVTSTYDCAGWGDTSRADAKTAPIIGTPAVRLMQGKAATVAAVTLDCDWSAAAPDGQVMWLHPGIAKLMKLPAAKVHSMNRPVVLQLVVVVPDSGKPSVIGADVDYLLPR